MADAIARYYVPTCYDTIEWACQNPEGVLFGTQIHAAWPQNKVLLLI